MEFVTHTKKIVCVFLQGNAAEIISRLHKERGVDTCDINRGRGRSTSNPTSKTYGEYVEVEILSMASIGPIISVLVTGLWIRSRTS